MSVYRVYAKLLGLLLVVLAVLDTGFLPIAGIVTPIPQKVDTSTLILGAALLLFGS